MKLNSILLCGLLAAGFNAHADKKPVLTNEHVDIGVAFEDGEWDLHIHDETNDVEYEPSGAVLSVGAMARAKVTADPAFAFLGKPGSTVWILPQVQNPDLIFLGFGAEEIPPGLFLNDSYELHLKKVKGGHFAVWDVDSFGTPQVLMNTRDGIGEADVFIGQAQGHQDLNWAFSKPGRYRVTFEARATLADGTVVSSGDVTYRFDVRRKPKASKT